MKVKTRLASELDKKKTDDNDRSYDARCKNILSDTKLSSYIINAYIPEFQDIDVDDIPSYIRYAAKNMNVEDKEISGEPVTYDLLLEMRNPVSPEEEVGIIINLEAHNEGGSPYEFLYRAFYYCSRLIARQKREFKADYSKIKKVYGIWIVLTDAKKRMGKVRSFRMNQYNLTEGDTEMIDSGYYDHEEIITVYPKERYDPTGTSKDVLELLTLIFRDKMEVKEKIVQLENRYDMIMEKEVVEDMCNLSQYHEGVGRREGIAIGRVQTMLDNLTSIMKKAKMTLNEAMDFLDVSNDLRPEIEEYFKKKKND